MKRQIRICGGVAYIPLTRGHEAVIDTSDVPLVDKWNWYARVDKYGCVYAGRKVRTGTPSKLRVIHLHRVIAKVPDEMMCDHRDGNGLNNRRSNLRVATNSENQCNRQSAQSNNTTGVKGVSRSGCKWIARIKKNGIAYYLGTYASVEQASLAYESASVRLHGNFSPVYSRYVDQLG